MLLCLQGPKGFFFISWEPPPLKFVKVNFDGSVKDDKGMLILSFMVRTLSYRLQGVLSFLVIYLESRVQDAWAGIICAR